MRASSWGVARGAETDDETRVGLDVYWTSMVRTHGLEEYVVSLRVELGAE